MMLRGACMAALVAIGVAAAPTLARADSDFQPTGSMTQSRAGATVTLLNNGKVLIAGGYNGADLDTAELYDPVTGAFTPTRGKMTSPRGLDTATLLPSGKVLIAGGYNHAPAGYLNTAELYDPTTDTFTATAGTMTTPRADFTATPLPDGRVLIAGGDNPTGDLDTAEIYNPAWNTFTATTHHMTVARSYQVDAALPNGKVLIAGGLSGDSVLDSAELYDPLTDMFTATRGTMTTPREQPSATVLQSGKVLLAGGFSGADEAQTASAETYDPATDTFTATAHPLAGPRAYHTATLLPNGTVLLAGGNSAFGTYLNTAEVYDPTLDAFTPAADVMNSSAQGRGAVLLPNGRVLIAGGTNTTYLNAAELYAPPAAPTCSDTNATAAYQTAATITLACSGPPGHPLTFSTVSAPAHGTLSGLDAAHGSVVYAPAAGYTGSDSFTFRASDSGGSSSTATVDVVVAAPPPPACENTSFVVKIHQPTTVRLPCTGHDNQPVTFSIDSGPAHGALSGLDASTGTITYTPDRTFYGTDSFTYRATGPGGSSATGTAEAWVTLPTVAITGTAQDVKARSAKLTGVVYGDGVLAWKFIYGPTARYGFNTPIQHVAADGHSVGVAITIDKLRPGTTYHFLLEANGVGGFALGNDGTFKTEPVYPVLPAPSKKSGSSAPAGADRPAPKDWDTLVDFGWLRPDSNYTDSALDQDLRRAAVLLQAGCRLQDVQHFNQIENGDLNDTGPGDDRIAGLVGKAALLQLLEQDPAAITITMGLRTKNLPPGYIMPMGYAWSLYRACLDDNAPGWDKGRPDTRPGWWDVYLHMEVIPPGWLPPGTDSSTGLPFCGRDHGNGDPVQAMLLRVWALMSRETMAGDRLRPGTAPRLPVSRMAIRQDFADRAWLDGGPKGIDEKFCRVVPESENHQWMIRTTRFLHNELLGVAHRIPPGGKYSWMNDYSDDQPNLDNGSNGAGAALRAKLEEWPKTDFLEYNARPYSYYQMIGLLNLFDFTRTRDMHYRAQEVLDFLSVKQAVESQDRARTAPFRRREEAGFEHGDLLDDDPLASMYQVWIGGETTTLTYPRKNELILAASSDYRPPRVLMQQMLGRRTRSDYETFNGKGQAEAGFAGPDFTITGGGFRTDCPYPTSPAEKALSFGLLPNCVGDGNSHGSTRPIVLLIHRNAMKQPPGGSWLDDAIHIDDYPYPSNLVCIYRNFACGPIVRIGRDLPGGSCKQTGTDGSGDPYTAIRLDDFVGRCHLAGETDPGQTCLYVYIVHKVPRYHDNAEDGSPIPKPMSYFVTHTCEHSQQLLDPNRPVRDRHPLVINSSQPAFSDFVDYMKTVGAPRVVPDRTGGELAIRLPAESGPIAPDQEIRVQSSILIDGTVPPYLLLSPAYSGASLAGTLAHLDDRGDLVIGPPGDQYTIGPSGIHLS